MGNEQHRMGPDQLLLELTKMSGVIRSSKAALIIGKTIIADIYDDHMVASQEPFTVFEDDGVWIITGVGKPKARAAIWLSKKDGTVLHLETPGIPFSIWDKEN